MVVHVCVHVYLPIKQNSTKSTLIQVELKKFRSPVPSPLQKKITPQIQLNYNKADWS